MALLYCLFCVSMLSMPMIQACVMHSHNTYRCYFRFAYSPSSQFLVTFPAPQLCLLDFHLYLIIYYIISGICACPPSSSQSYSPIPYYPYSATRHASSISDCHPLMSLSSNGPSPITIASSHPHSRLPSLALIQYCNDWIQKGFALSN